MENSQSVQHLLESMHTHDDMTLIAVTYLCRHVELTGLKTAQLATATQNSNRRKAGCYFCIQFYGDMSGRVRLVLKVKL